MSKGGGGSGRGGRSGGGGDAINGFVKSSSPHHEIFYNGKTRNLGDIFSKSPDLVQTKTQKGNTSLTKKSSDAQFRMAGQLINDNASIQSGGGGVIKTPSGKYYEISRGNRSAKPIPPDKIKETLNKYK
ncbi:MAG TPA: hypothetical protein V6C58_00165 [Allocoleopsis sp.]